MSIWTRIRRFFAKQAYTLGYEAGWEDGWEKHDTIAQTLAREYRLEELAETLAKRGEHESAASVRRMKHGW